MLGEKCLCEKLLVFSHSSDHDFPVPEEHKHPQFFPVFPPLDKNKETVRAKSTIRAPCSMRDMWKDLWEETGKMVSCFVLFLSISLPNFYHFMKSFHGFFNIFYFLSFHQIFIRWNLRHNSKLHSYFLLMFTLIRVCNVLCDHLYVECVMPLHVACVLP